MNLRSLTLFIFIICILLYTSCTSSRDATYFNDIRQSEYANHIQNLEPVIQKNDLLSITVSSMNREATEIFNVINASGRSVSPTSSVSESSGYLVDQEGYIQFPFLGKVAAAGKTKKSLRDEIRSELDKRKLLIEPTVEIRYLNYKVSVLGEVARPSVFTIANEKITMLEALGLAGDLTIFAKRDNVLLIREEQGKKTLTRIDLTTDQIFTSPYYYLKSNDIIYVEPNKSKIQSASATRNWLPMVFSGLSLAVIAVDRLLR